MSLSTLDIEKFNKVYTLMDRGGTEGERGAARMAAERIASAAGMSLNDAIRYAREAETSSSGRTHHAQSSKESESTRKAEAERERREAERRKDAEARFAAAEKRFGPAETAFAETPEEHALRMALAHLADFKRFPGSAGMHCTGFAGWTAGHPPAHLMKVLAKAIPMPASILDAWEELLKWDTLYQLRAAYDEYYEPEAWVTCRTEALASILDAMPVRSWEDFDTRMKWRLRRVEDGMAETYEESLAAHVRLAEDSKILRSLDLSNMDEAASGDAQHSKHGQSPVAVRRAAVRELLRTHPSMSDREIARRCGVSPQTVNNHRRSMAMSETQP